MSGHEPTVIRPAAPSPLVVSVPHAGTLIPDAELHRYALSSEVLAADVDLFVDRLYAEAPALGATLISTHVSRFVVDLNRFEDDLCPSVVLGSSRNTAAGYYGNRGVIWGVSTRGESIYRMPLPREVHAERIAAFYATLLMLSCSPAPPSMRPIMRAWRRSWSGRGRPSALRSCSTPTACRRLQRRRTQTPETAGPTSCRAT